MSNTASTPTDLFASATRKKLRFETGRGQLSTEDLWDLSLRDLDVLAVKVNYLLEAKRQSFLENPDPKGRKADQENEIRLEVLKAVISTKQDENKIARARADLAARKEYLEKLLAEKKFDELKAKSVADIEKELAEINSQG